MKALKDSLRVPERMGWNGDPCAPTNWDAWEGVTCRTSKNNTALVISQMYAFLFHSLILCNWSSNWLWKRKLWLNKVSYLKSLNNFDIWNFWKSYEYLRMLVIFHIMCLKCLDSHILQLLLYSHCILCGLYLFPLSEHRLSNRRVYATFLFMELLETPTKWKIVFF